MPVHPLTHVQVSGAVHCLFVLHGELQIAVLFLDYIMSLSRYVTIPFKQSLPLHPLRHIQVPGAVHCLLVPHGELQMAI